MDTALLFGAIIASLGIAAFGFLYFGTGDDSDGYDAVKRRADLKLKEKKPKESKKKKDKSQSKKVKRSSDPATEPLVPPEPTPTPEPEPVKEEKPVKKEAPKKEATPPPAPVEKKASKGEIVLVLKNKISDEEGENAIQAIVKKLGGRVPKGSKVTLASNVENLKTKMDELKKEKAKIEADFHAKCSENFEIESQILDAKKNADQMEQKAQTALVRAQKAEKLAADKQAEFERKIQSGEEGMSKEVEILKSTNKALQDSLMQNAQKMAKLGDAETLRKDLEKERALRFALDTENKALKESSKVNGEKVVALEGTVATLTATIADTQAKLEAASNIVDLSSELEAAKAEAVAAAAKVEQMQTEADAAKLEIESLQTASASQDEVDAAKSEIDALKADLEASKAEVDAAKTDAEQAKLSLSANETELNVTNTALQAAKQQAEEADAKNLETSKALEAAQQEIQSAQDKIEALEAKVAEIESNKDASSGEAADKLLQVTSELEAAKADIEMKKEEVSTANDDLAAAKDEVEANRAKIDELNSQLNEKVSELEKKTAEIEQIETASRETAEKFKSVEAQCEENLTKIKNIEDEKATLVTKNQELTAENSDLTQKLAANEDSLTVVNVDDDTAKDTKISQLEEEVSKLTDQVQQAKNKNEGAESKIVELEKQLGTTEESHSKITQELEGSIENYINKLKKVEEEAAKFGELDQLEQKNEDLVSEIVEKDEKINNLTNVLTNTESMLYDLQKSVKSEEDKMVQKIHDLETRLAVAAQGSGDNSQNGEGSSV